MWQLESTVLHRTTTLQPMQKSLPSVPLVRNSAPSCSTAAPSIHPANPAPCALVQSTGHISTVSFTAPTSTMLPMQDSTTRSFTRSWRSTPPNAVSSHPPCFPKMPSALSKHGRTTLIESITKSPPSLISEE